MTRSSIRNDSFQAACWRWKQLRFVRVSPPPLPPPAPPPPSLKRRLRNLCRFIFAPSDPETEKEASFIDYTFRAFRLSVFQEDRSRREKGERREGKRADGRVDQHGSLFDSCSSSLPSNRFIRHYICIEKEIRIQPDDPSNQPTTLSVPNPPSSPDAASPRPSPRPKALPILLLQVCEGLGDHQLQKRSVRGGRGKSASKIL